MKRSEALRNIATALILRSFDEDLSKIKPFNFDIAMELAETALKQMEEDNLFFCPVEDLGDFGTLRTPKGFDDETE